MNYDDACKYLDNCYKLGSKRGHENFKKLLELLGNPQEKLKIIHVAGTNGKGSCCAMLSSILIEEGYKVGVFSSPHLAKYNERFKIQGIDITDDEFALLMENVSQKVNQLFNGTNEYFAFFEIVTAMAFCYFLNNNVDYVLLEVGLGGRLDATNVIENPILSVITSISFDHTEFLGQTLEDIAKEKGGIIKENCNTVLYLQGNKVYNVISEICRMKNSRLFYCQDYNEKVIDRDFLSTTFKAEFFGKCYNNIKLRLLGDYQIKNACNVLLCVEALKNNNVKISDSSIINGLEKAKINGRMELIKNHNKYIILEGAHNEGGCKELCDFIKRIKKESNFKVAILMGVLKDKNFNSMVNDLNECSDMMMFTKPNNKRALESECLFNVLQDKSKFVFFDDDYQMAVKKATQINDIDVLIVCGSLYLIGDVRAFLGGESFDRL